MKTRIRIIACMVSLAFLVAVPSAMAQADKLIGVWKVTQVKYPADPEQNLDAYTDKSPQPRLWIFTKKHYSWMEVRGFEPRPDLPEEPTDSQIAEAYRRFLANSGTYEVKGSTITGLPIMAKGPNLMNSPRSFSLDFRFEGDSLIILQRTSIGVFESKCTRLE